MYKKFFDFHIFLFSWFFNTGNDVIIYIGLTRIAASNTAINDATN